MDDDQLPKTPFSPVIICIWIFTDGGEPSRTLAQLAMETSSADGQDDGPESDRPDKKNLPPKCYCPTGPKIRPRN